MKPGDKVIYMPKNQKGIIKSLSDDGTSAFVVYNCAEDWENYKDYTGVKTEVVDLTNGWPNEDDI